MIPLFPFLICGFCGVLFFVAGVRDAWAHWCERREMRLSRRRALRPIRVVTLDPFPAPTWWQRARPEVIAWGVGAAIAAAAVTLTIWSTSTSGR